MKGILLVTSLLFFSFFTQAQYTIISTQGGDWELDATWDLGRKPNASDIVLVQHDVFLENAGTVTAAKVVVSNKAAFNAKLSVGLGSILTVNGDLVVEGTKNDFDTDLVLTDNGRINVFGDAVISRLADNFYNVSTSLQMYDGSQFFVLENFIYNYSGYNIFENHTEISINDNANFAITRSINLNNFSGKHLTWTTSGNCTISCLEQFTIDQTGGADVSLTVAAGCNFSVGQGATINNSNTLFQDVNIIVNGVLDFQQNLNVTSSNDHADITFAVSGAGAELKVGGDLNIDGGNEQDVEIAMTNFAKFYLSGNVNRVNDFGNLNMSDNSTWVYNASSGTQDVPASFGAGTDDFIFTNVELISDADSLVLQGDLEVNKSIVLTKGILKTSKSAMLILNDGATISGGGPSAYVDGPVKKLSVANIGSFTFPLGDGGRYAPLTIENASGRAAGGEYVAQYYNCPPPWETDQAPNLAQISDEEHWSLARTQTSSPVNVTLHWSDAAAQGIDNTSSLVVAMYNPPASPNIAFPLGWTSIGNGGVVENGISGYVTNIGTCPPPWEVDQFTFGSVDGSNSLPIEMESLDAKLNGLTVDVNWATSLEQNTNRYVVEKSADGTNFSIMSAVNAKADDGGSAQYTVKDQNPQTGTNYYRIQVVDNDGMFTYTDIVSVNLKDRSTIAAYPNPFKGNLTLKGAQIKDAYQLRIMNHAGSVLMSQAIDSDDDYLQMESEVLEDLTPGVYFLEINAPAGAQIIKLMKAN